MKYLKKILIVLILALILNVRVKGFTYTYKETYDQPIVELRGAWVSTVSNIDIAKQTSIEQYKEQYLKILDNFEKFNMNAVFFQVRPTNDAFYKSEINPWSEFLIGQQGKDPGWDPLPWLVEETHKRGMEFHAWLNPYRASLDVFSSKDISESQYQTELASALNNMDDKNFAKKNPDLLIQGGVRILLNPAKEEVRQHIYDTITEIVTKYDVDAIHFDDYFYTDVKLEKDKALFLESYGLSSGQYDIVQHKNWRRHQVDLLVEGIHDLLETFNQTNNKSVQFGISPAAGWAPAISSGCPSAQTTTYGYGMEGGMEDYPCNGYSSYNDLYADTRKWVKEEWLDYMLPQNYFEMGRYHEGITDWWSRQVEGTSVRLYMGIGVYQFQYIKTLTEKEYINQLRFNQQYKNVSGIVIFSYRSLVNPSGTVWANAVKLLNDYWDTTPLLPALVNDKEPVETKAENLKVERRNRKIDVSFDTDVNAIGYALYRFNIGETPDFKLDNVVDFIPNNSSKITYTEEVLNTDNFDYYVKAVLNNGALSSSVEKVSASEDFINSVPIITVSNFSKSDIFAINEVVKISIETFDENNDDLVAYVEYSTNAGERYRYKNELVIINNKAYFEFTLPNTLTEDGILKVTVTDGSDETNILSHYFAVVSDDSTFIARQFSNVLRKINNSIDNIIGG